MAALFQKRKKEPAEKAPVEATQALQECSKPNSPKGA